MSKRELIAVVNREALDTSVPERVLLVPWGQVETKGNSGDFLLDRAGADLVLAAFRAQGVLLPLDFEHSTWLADTSKKGEKAPACGWIKELEVVDGKGIYGIVAWNESGRSAIANKEYLYLSPVVFCDRDNRRVTELHSAGLVNKPAIVGMEPLASINKESVMEQQKLENARWFLNLETTATADEVAASLEKLAAQIRTEAGGSAASVNREDILAMIKRGLKPDDLRPAVCKELGVDEKTTTNDVVALINRAKTTTAGNPDPTKFVSMDDHLKLKQKLDDTDAKVVSINRAAFIQAGLESGQISPNNRAAWEDKFTSNADGAIADLKLIPEGTFPKSGTVASVNRADTTPSKADRTVLINRAKADYAGEGGRVVCSKRDYINEVLRESSESALTEQEALVLSV